MTLVGVGLLIVIILGTGLCGAQFDGFGSRFPNWKTSNDRWQAGLLPSLRNNPLRGRLDGYLQYNHNDRLSVRGSGWADTRGNYGAGIGLQYRWKKRSAHLSRDRFYLSIVASPCQFKIYDLNSDGMIRREEVHEVFQDEGLAEKLFQDLDVFDGDNVILPEEFYMVAPKLIYGCGAVAVAPDNTEQESGPEVDSGPAEEDGGSPEDDISE